MRKPVIRGLVVAMVAALVLVGMTAPATAASRIGAPWVVAASPTSVTLDWHGNAGSYRVYSSRAGGGSKHSVKASTSRRVVTGLRPDRTYCFQVARSNGAGRSSAFCHTTPRRVGAPSAASISLVTFNVCGTVCGRWPARRAAVLRRILESSADVIALQEATRRIPELTRTLDAHGFDVVSSSQNEAIFARRDKLRREAFVAPGCHVVTDTAKEYDFPDWDKQHSHELGGKDFRWDEARQRWIYSYVHCTKGWRQWTPRSFGTIVLPDRRTAPWVSLLDVASGRSITVVSAHLSAGRSSAVARLHAKQVRRLNRAIRGRTAGPVVIAGDFNASRARGHDVPGKKLRQAGWVDAYDQATTFSRAYVSSSNGFEAMPRRDAHYGDHIDRIFVPHGFQVSDWTVVAPLRRGRNVRPMASDHHPVRATLWLP